MADVMIPPWLQPQPIAQMYAQGMNTGVAAAAQQNEAARASAALQQQAAIQASEMALRRDIAAQQAAQQGLSLQMDQQRNAALMALRERDMMNDLAYRSARLQDYDQGLQMREAALQNQFNKPAPALYPTKLPDGRTVYQTPGGAVYDPEPKTPLYDPVLMLGLRDLMDRREKLSGSITERTLNPDLLPQIDKQIEDTMRTLRARNSTMIPQTGATNSVNRFMWDNRSSQMVPVR